MKKLFIVLLFISISLSFFAMSIEQSAYNIKFYKNSFEKYQIEDATGKGIDELVTISEAIVSYLKNKGGNQLLEPYFNEKEVLHMEDVQKLFYLNRAIKYIGITIYLGIFIYLNKIKDYKSIGQAFFIGPFLNYAIFIILGILATIDFNKYFTYFHKIFFNNDLWLLDPRTDLMIQMLPEEFFIDMSKSILLSFLIYMAILQVAGYLYIKKGKEYDKKTKKRKRKTSRRK